MKFISIYTVDRGVHQTQPDEANIAPMGELIGNSGESELRVRKSGSQITVTGGPFTEMKEIVGGYAVLSVASRDVALLWTKRFLEVAGDGLSELHQLADYA
jgi:hypothetical protein